ncbi:hypothetical protein [Dickeya fangzhongdai]|uniref:hypothetical protein n=1 Tax=Dickeya fangzhongdai TaxID=1778540 RepID=UPI0023E45995|nr:hypothetical protein [Dickeya fangzhongdai]WES87990.1 hypothetical protein PQ617_17430 [Dickeya fangzhongdai]
MFAIAELILQHHYFPQGDWREASLVPDEYTRRQMRRFGLQLVAFGNTWRFYGGAITGRAAFLQYYATLADAQPFRFWVVQPRPYFVLITDMPLDWQGVLGFSSQRVMSEGAAQDTAQLIAGAPASDDAPDGAVAEICCHPDDLATRQSYAVSLQPRATTWEYRVIPRGQIRLQDPQVVDTSGQVAFSSPAALTAESGESDGWVTRSMSAIAFQQVPAQRLSLMDSQLADTPDGGARQRRILSALPTPAGTQPFTHRADDNLPVSVMYVYV